MSDAPLVIVGSGPAGLSAARSYRRARGSAPLVMVGEERHLPYRRPPLTKDFLRGEMQRHELWLEPPDWFSDHEVELRLGAGVVRIDPDRGELTLADGALLRATRCLIATGSEPTHPPLDGAADPEVLHVRRLPDSEALIQRARPGTSAAVIGSGFIGCEVAASLAAVGVEVTLISQERLPQARRLGEAAGERIAAWLRDAGVRLVLEAQVRAIERARRVLLDDLVLRADTVVLAAGVAPRSELARDCGLELHESAVRVDAGMRSSHPFVLAAGDVALATNAAVGRALHVEHWGDALGQGEIAGRVLAGEAALWSDVPGFWSTIAGHTLKYAAWGDGYDDARLDDHDDGAFTIWYARDGRLVGVLTHEREEDYRRGSELMAAGASPP